MKFVVSKEEKAAHAMKEAMGWLDGRGIYYQHLPPYQLKIGAINYWPRKGTITIDGETLRRSAKGLTGLEAIFAESRAGR